MFLCIWRCVLCTTFLLYTFSSRIQMLIISFYINLLNKLYSGLFGYELGGLNEMQSDGAFSDEITLHTMLKIFNVEFEMISTLGPAARQIITPHNSVAMTRLHVGHFAENKGTHYVALNPKQEECEGKYLHHFLHILLSLE